MNCYRCGAIPKLVNAVPVRHGKRSRREYVCPICGTRMSMLHKMTDTEWMHYREITKSAYDALERQRKERIGRGRARPRTKEGNYCDGSNCLNCRYEVCFEDILDDTKAV